MDYAGLIAALTPAVEAAGTVILDIKASGPTSTAKSDGSPVTLADQAAAVSYTHLTLPTKA